MVWLRPLNSHTFTQTRITWCSIWFSVYFKWRPITPVELYTHADTYYNYIQLYLIWHILHIYYTPKTSYYPHLSNTSKMLSDIFPEHDAPILWKLKWSDFDPVFCPPALPFFHQGLRWRCLGGNLPRNPSEKRKKKNMCEHANWLTLDLCILAGVRLLRLFKKYDMWKPFWI